MKFYILFLAVLIVFPALKLEGQFKAPVSFDTHLKQNLQSSFTTPFLSTQSPQFTLPQPSDQQTPILHEIGYIAAQQVAFTGLSYLASREKGYGPIIVGAFDAIMGTAGAFTATGDQSPTVKLGYLALSIGFYSKSYYVLSAGKEDSINRKFLTNYLAYNALIYLGYYLDSL